MNVTFSGREGLHIFLRHSYIYTVFLFRICELFQVTKYCFFQIEKYFYSHTRCLPLRCWPYIPPSDPPSWGWAPAEVINETKGLGEAMQLINPLSSLESLGRLHRFCLCSPVDWQWPPLSPAGWSLLPSTGSASSCWYAENCRQEDPQTRLKIILK